MHEFSSAVSEVLGAGIDVLLYAGEYDFICNWMGNHAWSLEMEWDHKDAFNAAANTTWTASDGEVGGSYISANEGQFTFLKVKDGGHMVPRDQPAKSLDMVRQHLFSKFL
jgi:cathepsin A (carboxypeptidase C)